MGVESPPMPTSMGDVAFAGAFAQAELLRSSAAKATELVDLYLDRIGPATGPRVAVNRSLH